MLMKVHSLLLCLSSWKTFLTITIIVTSLWATVHAQGKSDRHQTVKSQVLSGAVSLSPYKPIANQQ